MQTFNDALVNIIILEQKFKINCISVGESWWQIDCSAMCLTWCPHETQALISPISGSNRALSTIHSD